MAFPTSPYEGQQYTIDDVTWVYNSRVGAWDLTKRNFAKSPDIQAFTSSGTWGKNANADVVMVTCIGAGQAGQAGLFTGTNTGGAGGYGGGVSQAVFNAADLGSTVTITVGGGGTSSFGAGGSSFFGGSGTSTGSLRAVGGRLGGGQGFFDSGTPGSGASGSAATSATDSYGAAGSGGGGATPTYTTPGSGGAAAGHSVPAATVGSSVLPTPGGGGGGGSSAGGAGTAGSVYGGGGGGGGANNPTLGAGGAGANGIVIVTTWYSA